MKRVLSAIAVLLLVTGVVSTAQAYTVTYKWSLDPAGEIAGGTVLGTYGAVEASLNSESSAAHSEEYSLKLVDTGSDSATPQAYVGWVTGLQTGDQVTAGFWAWDNTPAASPSGRIWGHYTNDVNNIDSYAGSADGNGKFSGTDGIWTYLEHTWTFDAGTDRNGLVIEARVYSDLGDTIYIDDLTITAPDHATIVVPTPIPGAVWLLGSGLIGLLGFRRRKV